MVIAIELPQTFQMCKKIKCYIIIHKLKHFWFFSQATVVCDLVLLYLLPKREFYKNMKFKYTDTQAQVSSMIAYELFTWCRFCCDVTLVWTQGGSTDAFNSHPQCRQTHNRLPQYLVVSFFILRMHISFLWRNASYIRSRHPHMHTGLAATFSHHQINTVFIPITFIASAGPSMLGTVQPFNLIEDEISLPPSPRQFPSFTETGRTFCICSMTASRLV